MERNMQAGQTVSVDGETAVRMLYRRLLDGWNARNADAFAALFVDDGDVIGFDGSQMAGQSEIAATLRQIFADHQTAAYVAKVRSVRFVAPGVAVLRAVSGLAPHGTAELNPLANSIQTLVAVHADGEWRIVLFQNTPAQFHGRPELVQALTEELRALL
jgi:uncharacterized protein (TIGR02246 family)